MLELTDEGRTHAYSDPVRSVADVHRRLLDLCTGPQRQLLQVLIDRYPHEISP